MDLCRHADVQCKLLANDPSASTARMYASGRESVGIVLGLIIGIARVLLAKLAIAAIRMILRFIRMGVFTPNV